MARASSIILPVAISRLAVPPPSRPIPRLVNIITRIWHDRSEALHFGCTSALQNRVLFILHEERALCKADLVYRCRIEVRHNRVGMSYYLAKSEPGVYSIDDLARDKRTTWDGVRNAQAVKTILSMQEGDSVFIYHSGGESQVVGLARVVKGGRPDPKDPKSAVMDLEFVSKLDPPVTLAAIKQSGLFSDWALVRQSRLSTMAAPDSFVAWLKKATATRA
jgi:predicted RNA-binding protein with PUA-like domain